MRETELFFFLFFLQLRIHIGIYVNTYIFFIQMRLRRTSTDLLNIYKEEKLPNTVSVEEESN